MLAAASALALLSAWFLVAWLFRRDMPGTRWFLRASACAGVVAMVALESGWVLTEVGRQPWVVYGFLRTSQAVTHAPGIWGSFAVVVAIYAVVGIALLLILRAMSRRWRDGKGDELPVPYAPRGPLTLPSPGGTAVGEGRSA